MRGIKSPLLLARQVPPHFALRSLFLLYKLLMKVRPLHARGRPPVHGLLAHLVISLVKMRTNLPYRCPEQWTEMPRATLARMVTRTTRL